MKKAWLWILLVLSLGVNIGVLTTIGVARNRMQQRWERPAGRQDRQPGPPQQLMDRIADHLHLEGEQREQFKELQSRFFQETRLQRRKLMGLRGELHDELNSQGPDQERVESLLAQLGRSYIALDRAMVDNVKASREILDAEQQDRYLGVLARIRQASRREMDRGGRPARPHRERPPG